MHDGLHVVALRQITAPGHAAVVPVPQLPAPVQVAAVVS
jgi:hypothetical protein